MASRHYRVKRNCVAEIPMNIYNFYKLQILKISFPAIAFFSLSVIFPCVMIAMEAPLHKKPAAAPEPKFRGVLNFDSLLPHEGKVKEWSEGTFHDKKENRPFSIDQVHSLLAAKANAGKPSDFQGNIVTAAFTVIIKLENQTYAVTRAIIEKPGDAKKFLSGFKKEEDTPPDKLFGNARKRIICPSFKENSNIQALWVSLQLLQERSR